MAVYMLGIVVVSIIIGLIYEKNAFCGYVCPVGYNLGLYSRFSPIGWRVGSKKVCDSCKDKSCIHKIYLYNQNYKSCGVGLYPATVEDNSICIMCGGCRKSCGTYITGDGEGRPNPGFRYTGFDEMFSLKPLNTAQMFFVFILSGFIISQIWTEWNVTTSILNQVSGTILSPMQLAGTGFGNLLHGVIIFAAIPLIIWFLPFITGRLAGASIKLKEYFLNYGIVFIPIVAAGHLSKSLIKSILRIPYFEHLFGDLAGVRTAQGIIVGEISLGQIPVWLNLSLSIIITAVIVAGIWISFRLVRLMNQKMGLAGSGIAMYLIPVIYGSIFFFMIVIWRWF